MKRIAIFASGSGTNAENIIRHFHEPAKRAEIMVFCNNPSASVIEKAKNLHVPCTVFNRSDLYDTGKAEKMLAHFRPDLVVLAGFLWLVPETMIRSYAGKIINIHPALLPAYGGKGFYGNRVHEAVLNTSEKKSGITVHYVNEKFDEGEIILQKECEVNAEDTVESLARKIHALEHEYYPKVIEELIYK